MKIEAERAERRAAPKPARIPPGDRSTYSSTEGLQVPKATFDWKPLVLLAALMAVGLPLVGSSSIWLTLTVAGLAMGFIIFVIASGLTLVFGLMDVLNFGHGVFIALGAFVATSVMGGLAAWDGWWSLLAIFVAMVVAMAVAGAVGYAFERLIVRPVYGLHLKQILITMGGMIVGEELIKVIWGPLQIPLPLPELLRGSFQVGEASIEKYRLLAVAISSMPQQAVAKGMGQRLERRAQLMTRCNCVVRNPSTGMAASRPMTNTSPEGAGGASGTRGW